MPTKRVDLSRLAENPSLMAMIYQAIALGDELSSISGPDYPPEASHISRLFQSLVTYISKQLWALYDHSNPFGFVGQNAPARARSLTELIHLIYAYVRYLRTTTAVQTSPALQVVITQLTNRHFPSKQNGDPLCIIRPQWDYNFEYVPITLALRDLVSSQSVIDPDDHFHASTADDLLDAIWKTHRPRGVSEERRPRQVAVLSFPGLDTYDALLYPMLAHELGHFIDYSYFPHLHASKQLNHSSRIRWSEVENIFLSSYGRATPLEVSEKLAELGELVRVSLRELLADLIAVRILGFAYFVTQAEFLKVFAPWGEAAITRSGYPGIRLRLRVSFTHLLTHMKQPLPRFLDSHERKHTQVTKAIRLYLDAWEHRLSPTTAPSSNLVPGTDPNQQFINLAEHAVLNSLPNLTKLAIKVVPLDRTAQLSPQFFERVELLRHQLPPALQDDDCDAFGEILSSAWSYQLLYGEDIEAHSADLDHKRSLYTRTCRLVTKAIELLTAPPAVSHDRHAGSASETRRPGVLGTSAILSRTGLATSDSRRIGIVPFDAGLVGAASLDVRLGHWFRVSKRSRLPNIELSDVPPGSGPSYDERVFVPVGSSFYLHPGDFVLGCTLEFISLPSDVMAFVEGRSGVGRQGLIVATATQVAPGFHGVVVLELANAGTLPLALHPGIRIAQLVFQTLSQAVPQNSLYRGRYHCQVEP